MSRKHRSNQPRCAKQPDPEVLRRLRVGDLKRFLRYRYGPTLPDDDAGRDDLNELLLPVSLMPKSPALVMRNMIETWAPWMAAEEAYSVVQQIERTPPRLRNRTAKDLGRRLNVTNAEREHLKLRTIAPADMTDEQWSEWRKQKKRQCERLRLQRKRRQAGIRSRTIYLANSLSTQKPWQIQGISRRTWYRRRTSNLAQPVAQVVRPINSYQYKQQTCATEQGESQQGTTERKRRQG